MKSLICAESGGQTKTARHTQFVNVDRITDTSSEPTITTSKSTMVMCRQNVRAAVSNDGAFLTRDLG